MSNTDDHINITSSSPSGATVATDYISSTGEHIQEVKLNVGGANEDALLSDTNSIPVRNSTVSFLRVSGNTSGTQAISVSISGGATLEASNVTLSGGTLHGICLGVSSDIRSVKAGVTIGAVPIGTTTITGDVMLLTGYNNIGNVDVLTVTIPSIGPKYGSVMVSNTAVTLGTAGYGPTFDSGVRITNYNTANTILVGRAGVTAGGTAAGFPLPPLDSLFLEVDNGAVVHIIAEAAGGTGEVRYIGT